MTFFFGCFSLSALRGVWAPELTLVSGAGRLGILYEESHRGFSARPASFPIHLLPFPDPVLVTVLAEDLESFGPPEPLLLLVFFRPSWPYEKQQQPCQQSGGTGSTHLQTQRRSEHRTVKGLWRHPWRPKSYALRSCSPCTEPFVGPAACYHSSVKVLTCCPSGCHYG